MALVVTMYMVYLVMILIWQFDKSCNDCQTEYTLFTEPAIYTVSMGYFPHSTQIHHLFQ